MYGTPIICMIHVSSSYVKHNTHFKQPILRVCVWVGRGGEIQSICANFLNDQQISTFIVSMWSLMPQALFLLI